MADVTHRLPGLRMPRTVMQVCVASITTATPLASSSSSSRFAMVSVIRSCTWGRRATASTTRKFAQTDHAAVRDIADVSLAHERQHVVLAHAIEADIAHQHDLVVLLGKELPQAHARVFPQAAKQFGIHAGHASRGFHQALAIRIFAHCRQNFAHGPRDARFVDSSRDRPPLGVIFLRRQASQVCIDRFARTFVIASHHRILERHTATGQGAVRSTRAIVRDSVKNP